MALKNRSDQKVAYAKIKDGKFYLSTDKEYKTPFDSLEGKVTDLYFKDETYEGKTIKKVYVGVSDGEEKTLVGFSFDSSYMTSLVGFLVNADLSQPLELSPIEKEVINDGVVSKRRSILVKQNGAFMKNHFTKTEPNGLPEMKKVKFNGKELWDKTLYLEFYEKTINDVLKPQLGHDVTQAGVAIETISPLPWEGKGEDVDPDLPF